MTDEDTIMQIARLRAGNNGLWMGLLELALEVAPDETKILLREINTNDRAISDLFTELAK